MHKVAFRIDVMKRVYNKAAWPSWFDCDNYKVPCGMVSIVYLNNTFARDVNLKAIANSLADNQVAVASRWNIMLNEYVVYDVFDKNDYAKGEYQSKY